MSRPENRENLQSLADQVVWALQTYNSLYEYQDDATLVQDDPVSTEINPVLLASDKVKVYSISASVTWTVQPSPLEIIVIIDGTTTILHVQEDPVSEQEYSAILLAGEPPWLQGMDTTGLASSRAFIYEGHNVAINARTTGGTVSNITCRVKWGQIP